MKLALAMIVKGDPREARMLDRCLKNLAPHVDGIYITATYKDNPHEADAVKDVVDKYSRKYNAHVSTLKWVNDFAFARNYNFGKVPKEYDFIMWTDADDVWRGAEKLRKTIEANKHVDAFGFWYYYDWDKSKRPTVVHKKTMVVRNDGCVEWKGALHEEFEGNREITSMLVNGIERLHISDDEDRRKENAKRNLEIAKLEAHKLKDDPRSFWNLGNAQFGVHDFEGAVATFQKFLAESKSDEEKYIAHTRLAHIFRDLQRYEEGVRELQIAIGMRPFIPDAYIELAHLYYTMGNLDKAEEYVLQGMIRKPQIHKMIVFNPRDYDFNPMMLAARIYAAKGRPDKMLTFLEGCLRVYPNDDGLKMLVRNGKKDKEKLAKVLRTVQRLQKIRSRNKLKQELDKLPLEVASHPAIVILRNEHFVKKESSGKDIVFYCGNTTHEWFPGSSDFIGGSEEAVINLAEELSKSGWNVTVYNSCGNMEKRFGKVTYKPFWMWNYRDKQDVVVLWRWTKPLDAEINAPKVFVDLHDVISPGEFNERRLTKITKVMVKSQFHRSLYPNVPDHKIAVIPNGIDLSLLRGAKVKRDPYLIINTSSPDRSLDVLPKLFKEVKKQVPKAKLEWAYGWELCERGFSDDAEKMKWIADTKKAMKDAGIKTLGRLSQQDVGKLYQKARILAYPTEFAEIDCISVRKAQAAGCLPIATDFGALDESIEWGVKVHSKKTAKTWNRPYQFHYGIEDEAAQHAWVNAMVSTLKDGINSPHPSMEKFSWPAIAKRWEALL